MKHRAAFVVLSVAFLSCAPKYETIVMKEYQARKIPNASLVVAPIVNLVVDYVGNVKDEFGEGNQEELIIKHFRDKLLQGLREESLFSRVGFDSFAKQPAMGECSFTTSDNYGLSLSIPSDTATINFASSTPDFILFIQDLYIGKVSLQENGPWGWSREETSTIPVAMPDEKYGLPPAALSYKELNASWSGFQPPVYTPPYNPPMFFYSPPKTPYLRYKCEFAFWDNHLHKVVAYGKIFAKSQLETYGLGMVNVARMSNWNDIDYQLVRALLGQTPFDR